MPDTWFGIKFPMSLHMVLPSTEKSVPAEGSSTKPTICFPVAPGEPRLSLAAVGRASWVSFLLKNGGEAADGVSHMHAGNFFCLWKYCDLTHQGTHGEIFISAFL